MPVVLGRTYRFRFRISNIIGWSEFSDTEYILAATVPDRPISAPTLVSVDKDQITIKLGQPGVNNGDLITHYVLYV